MYNNLSSLTFQSANGNDTFLIAEKILIAFVCNPRVRLTYPIYSKGFFGGYSVGLMSVCFAFYCSKYLYKIYTQIATAVLFSDISKINVFNFLSIKCCHMETVFMFKITETIN
jgi:hypothetical protein